MIGVFIDPRTHPDPQAPRPPARYTANAEELVELHRLCREARLYDVERWIQAGRPLQLQAGGEPDYRRPATALAIALERRDRALLLLLLANGYDSNAEAVSPLDEALEKRDHELLDLLLDWGADPQRVEVVTLCETYDRVLFERFRAFGVDFSSGHAIADALGNHTSNKPLFGFAKKHRLADPGIQRELDIALAHHAGRGNAKGVQLCLWAGANPHAEVPDLESVLYHRQEDEDDGYSAVYEACSNGHAEILKRLKPDPELDDFEELYCRAAGAEVVEVLARSALPKDHSRVMHFQLSRLAWGFRTRGSTRTLQALFASGVRWETSSKAEIAEIRRDLLRLSDWSFEELMKLLGTNDHCSSEVLTELARTSSMRGRMKAVGLIPSSPRERSSFNRSRPSEARTKLAKFGVELPRGKAPESAMPLHRVVRLGARSLSGRELRFTRAALLDRVWSVPVDTLAKEWGLSGRGLAKACRRLKVPVPPRGYWARLKAGKAARRPKLPELPPGQGEEIVICLPEAGGHP